jgi:Flp pilus assembly protein CpaB
MRRKGPLLAIIAAAIIILISVFALRALTHHAPPPPKPKKVATAPAKPVNRVFAVLGLGGATSAGTFIKPGMVVPVPMIAGLNFPKPASPPQKKGKSKSKGSTSTPSNNNAAMQVALAKKIHHPKAYAKAHGLIRFSAKTEMSFNGAMLKENEPPGTPLTRSMLLFPGHRGFLAAALPKGYQAITIPVNAIVDQSGLLWPGDQVDVILAESVPTQIAVGHNLADQVIMSGVKVLAIGDAFRGSSYISGDPTVKGNLVTLAVSPLEVSKLILAQGMGQLSIAVDSQQDKPKNLANPGAPVYASQVSPVITSRDYDDITVFNQNGQQGYAVP